MGAPQWPARERSRRAQRALHPSWEQSDAHLDRDRSRLPDRAAHQDTGLHADGSHAVRRGRLVVAVRVRGRNREPSAGRGSALPDREESGGEGVPRSLQAAARCGHGRREDDVPRVPVGAGKGQGEVKSATYGLLFALTIVASARADAGGCESLAAFSRPHTAITLAQTVSAGQFTPPAGRGAGRGANPFAPLPEFCRVAATLTPVNDSEIKIEVWLPANWNGKLQSVGNGAWAGNLSYPAMATAVAAGYAAASTDTGHAGGNANFIVGHPEKLVDFEERAVHEMTGAARAIVDAFYGRAPQRAYFNGCSTGGRQALTEVQRYPADYDAIIAGAPANFAKRQTFGQIWLWQATHKDAA